MSDRFKQYVLDWNLSEEGLPLWKYLATHSSVEEMQDMFHEIKTSMTQSPCCSRHRGAFPLADDTLEKSHRTPGVLMYNCGDTRRGDSRGLARAIRFLKTGQEPTDLCYSK